jgi:pyruvate,water dikinase
MESMTYLHQKYAVPCLAPIGDLLAQVREWTGLGPSEVLGVTRGSSEVALGFAVRELEALAAAIRMDGSVRSRFAEERDERKSLAALLELKGAIGEAAREFMRLVRYRAIGYDVGERLVGELPEVVVRCIQSAVDGHFQPSPDDAAAWTSKVRGSIPAKHQAEFDELLAEARTMGRLRDERGTYADCFAIGIARRALLEAGARLAARGQLHDGEHAVDLTMSELEGLFEDHGSPSADLVEARGVWRTTTTAKECPSHLGLPPAEPPSPELLPMDARRPARAVAAVLAGMFSVAPASSVRGVIRGLSVNRGVYEGVARKVDGPSEFWRIRRGDVLVTRTTGPHFNFILPLLGAIVTDRGGQLSHAAIVAREYGIPGVVGTKDATELIPDGARVRVDGTQAEVTVL